MVATYDPGDRFSDAVKLTRLLSAVHVDRLRAADAIRRAAELRCMTRETIERTRESRRLLEESQRKWHMTD